MRTPRRLRPEEHENRERWLVPYADFLTLLLALFVVLYAMSQVNAGKPGTPMGFFIDLSGGRTARPETAAALPAPLPLRKPARRPISMPSDEVRNDPPSEPPLADAPASVPAVPATTEDETDRLAAARRERLAAVARDVAAAFVPFAPLMQDGQVKIVPGVRGVGVEINAQVLFAPGQAAVREDAARMLEILAQVLKDGDHLIQVEGYTDDIPIATGRFPSNWELSAMRASSVVRLLIDHGVEATRLTALGHGENHPLASNDTVEGRMRNRRVTVLILPAPPDPGTADHPAASIPPLIPSSS
ncbi:OmpA family protein [Nitrosovibrio sp. Nv17]|uniref:OmpA family protein n=1 Tax=Nitrosovibrio sp. Nv17 TaxID=1855339 RepID=UPI0009318CB0|nr:OmpA family protein [Nitrosovibrio sp. Nv17]